MHHREFSAALRGLRVATAAAAIACAGDVAARDYFLTIGGGYDPSGNPASLERDVIFARTALESVGAGDAPHDVYFADGDDPQRDVQYIDAAAKRDGPPAVRIMAELFGDPKTIGFRYRDNELPAVAGPTDFAVLDRRFRELARELKAGDRLFIYAAGHGGEAYDPAQAAAEAGADARHDAPGDSGVPQNPYDTSLALWNNDELRASELCRWLDRLPRDVTVVLVMVQCYSGGFAHAIFERNDQELGLSPARRCGFFSQLHDRAAAGCAAELGADDVEEYSTYFWAATGGKTRTGEPVNADYDHDGSTSFAEAHAYAVIESDTIDVPVRTSEALLRRYSRLGGPYGTLGAVAESDAQKSDQSGGALTPAALANLVEPSGPLTAIAALARPDQRAIIGRLGSALAAGRGLTVEDVRVELSAAEEAWAEAQEALDSAMSLTDEAQIAAQDDVYREWPELYFAYSPMAAELMGPQGAEFVAFVEGRGSYGALVAARRREDELAAACDRAECALAKIERLLRTIDDVVLAANLPKVAPTEIVERYEELIEMEEATLSGEP